MTSCNTHGGLATLAWQLCDGCALQCFIPITERVREPLLCISCTPLDQGCGFKGCRQLSEGCVLRIDSLATISCNPSQLCQTSATVLKPLFQRLQSSLFSSDRTIAWFAERLSSFMISYEHGRKDPTREIAGAEGVGFLTLWFYQFGPILLEILNHKLIAHHLLELKHNLKHRKDPGSPT